MIDDAPARRGPRRPPGSPSGPAQVRRAVLDSAARLFTTRGMNAVSLRDVAADADVQLALIGRYIGTREDLILAVFDDLSIKLAAAIDDDGQGEQHSYNSDAVLSQWVRVAVELVIAGHHLVGRNDFNPVLSLAQTSQDLYGLDDTAARIRAAQIFGSVMGWRIFEDYLVEAAGLGEVSRAALRDELNRTHHRLGATPWPSPPDPARRGQSPKRPRARRDTRKKR